MEFFEKIDVSHEQAALITRGLFALSRVDGHDEREGLLIKQLWMEAVGSGWVLDLKVLENQSDFNPADLARGLESRGHRELFLKTAVLLAYADGKVSALEKAWLAKAAKALDYSQEALARLDELVRTYLLSQLSHIQNVEATTQVAKKLGF